MTIRKVVMGSLLAALLAAAGCGDSTPGTSDVGADKGPDFGQLDTSVDGGGGEGVTPDATVDAPASDADGGGAVEGGVEAGADLTVDLSVQPDITPIDAGPPPDAGTSGKREYVYNDILLPTTPAEAARYGYDYDNDGIPDNALGNILSAIGSLLGNVSVAEQMSLSVASGNTLPLMRVQATSFVNHTGTVATFWMAQPKACCTSTILSTCQQQAASTCFTGSVSFTTATSPVTLNGSITSTVGTFTASSLTLPLTLFPGQSLTLTLTKPYVIGRFASNQIVEGRLTGVLTQSELNNTVIPSLATLIDTLVKDPNISTTTKATLLNLFDANNDGSITTSEIANNSLIKTFLAGDVDIDNDGKKELSLGVGFSAVGAIIQ